MATTRPTPTRLIGSLLAYQTAESSPRIFVAADDGSAPRQLVRGSHPDWSPDGGWIAYQDDAGDIWIVRSDGSDQRRVFDCEDPCLFGDSAAWSPDGESIAFTTADGINGEAPKATAMAVDVASGSTRELFSSAGPDYPFYPRWSPDGAALVLSIQRFATKSVDDCSPTGSAVAIVDVSAATSKARFLTEFSMYADYPDWSPDGSRIVFTTYDLGTREFDCAQHPEVASDLYTINVDGSGLRQLTHNATGKTLIRPVSGGRGTASGPLAAQPTWTPDGDGIVYTHVDGPTWPGVEAWLMDADGSSAHSLGAPPFVGEHPRFQPSGYAPWN